MANTAPGAVPAAGWDGGNGESAWLRRCRTVRLAAPGLARAQAACCISSFACPGAASPLGQGHAAGKGCLQCIVSVLLGPSSLLGQAVCAVVVDSGSITVSSQQCAGDGHARRRAAASQPPPGRGRPAPTRRDWSVLPPPGMGIHRAHGVFRPRSRPGYAPAGGGVQIDQFRMLEQQGSRAFVRIPQFGNRARGVAQRAELDPRKGFLQLAKGRLAGGAAVSALLRRRSPPTLRARVLRGKCISMQTARSVSWPSSCTNGVTCIGATASGGAARTRQTAGY